ncbi:DKNYY domain-containing protein [Mycolicibacterium sp.]|uniref:DKNYY domain-containing protein n=1 Tax=Mycolicibacterium sp. TaxID=2320850 RepID=UPI003D148A5D
MRRFIAAAFLVAVALSGGCSRAQEPNSLVDDAGYHVRGNTVFYLNPFPGKAFPVEGADAATFEVFDRTYARDRARVYINGHLLDGAHAGSFELLDRPGFAKDSARVYQHDQPISSDPDHFVLLDHDLAKDSISVYWSDGTVLSRDPDHFIVVSDREHYLFAKDSTTVFVNGNPLPDADPTSFRVLQGAYSRDDERAYYFDEEIRGADAATLHPLAGPYAVDAQRVYWMGKVIDGADPGTFRVLNANFECSADAARAYYRQHVIPHADPATFPRDRTVTGCSATSISFGD